jgi:hypothetical protein
MAQHFIYVSVNSFHVGEGLPSKLLADGPVISGVDPTLN